jgi:hypothetical protein
VDEHRSVAFDQQETGCGRQVRGQPTDIVDRTASYDCAHGRRRYPVGSGRRVPTVPYLGD